eukprot:745895-Hanusia_phi.AAC.4
MAELQEKLAMSMREREETVRPLCLAGKLVGFVTFRPKEQEKQKLKQELDLILVSRYWVRKSDPELYFAGRSKVQNQVQDDEVVPPRPRPFSLTCFSAG